MNVSQAIAAMVKAYGGEYLFTLTGGPQEPLIAGKVHEDLSIVLGRTERSTFCMADGYARLTGKPTFGMCQAGVGTTYLPPSLVDSHWGHSPVIAISSSTLSSSRYRYEYQEANGVPMLPPITKWSGELPAPDRIYDVMRTAVRAAMSGNPGPAFLSIPWDWYTKDIEGDPDVYAEADFLQLPAIPSAPLAADIDRAVAVLAGSQRPVILAGGGVLLSGAWRELTALAEALNIPVVTSMSGKGSISDSHPLCIGVAGRYSRKVANDVLTDCDTCLVIGSRLGSMGTDSFRFPAQGTRIIHIDVDPMTLGCTYREEVSILGDARIALDMLLDAVVQAKVPRSTDWTTTVQGHLANWREAVLKAAATTIIGGRLNPYFVMGCLDEVVQGDDILVSDTGFMAAWAATLVDQKTAGRNFLRAAGSLGWAFPGGLGAKLAAGPNRKVTTLIGDGGLGYHLADLETALRLKLPVVTVVMNNAAFGFSYQVQKNLQNERCPEAVEFMDLDFATIAKAFGGHGERVTDPDQVIPAIRRAEDSGKPAIVDIAVTRDSQPPVSRVHADGKRDI